MMKGPSGRGLKLKVGGWLMVTLLVSCTKAEETAEEKWPFYPVLPVASTAQGEMSADYVEMSDAVISSTYALDRKMPPGCECRKTGDSDDECTLFECSCVCDLTAGMCDPDCCCDPECTDEEIERFQDLGTCVPEGPVEEEITRCYTTKEVDSINPKFPMSAKGTAKDAVDRALCVRYDNSQLRGDFYADPGLPESSIFDDSDGQKDFDYPLWVAPDPTPYATDQTYDSGDPIGAAFSVSDVADLPGLEDVSETSGFVLAYDGVLPLPRAGPDSGCVESHSARFGIKSTGECLQKVVDLESECASYGVFPVASRLYVGAHAGSSASGSDWVPIVVRNAYFKDSESTSGISVPYPDFDADTVNCNARYELYGQPTSEPTTSPPTGTPTSSSPSAVPTSTPTDASAAPTSEPTTSTPTVFTVPTSGPTAVPTSVPTTEPTTSTPTVAPSLTPTVGTSAPTGACVNSVDGADRAAAPACRNVVSDVRYIFVHQTDDINRIVAAYADVTLTDLPSTFLDDDGAVVFSRTASIEFRPGTSPERSEDYANLVNRTRSGNPGYLFGHPVLAAKDASSYVVPRKAGLSILGGAVDCVDADLYGVAVPFGSDARAGCLIDLNRTELRDLCLGIGPHASDRGVPKYFNVSDVFSDEPSLVDEFVGKFGNADPLDKTQWLEIDIVPPTDAASWHDRDSVCQNLITTMNYRFLWAYVGAKDNPQPKIIAARVDFSKEDVRYRLDGTGASAPLQPLPIRVTATFVQHSKHHRSYKPPAPPVAISVPYDVWYPFKVESSSSHISPFLLPLFLAASLSALFFLSSSS